MASKYYAVKKGKVPGIYFNWNDCKAMVDGYQGAVYKSFKTIAIGLCNLVKGAVDKRIRTIFAG